MTRRLTFRVGNAELVFHPLALLSVASLLFAENTVYALSVLLCAALHEIGHIAVLYLCGGKVVRLSFLPCGMEICMSPLSYRRETAVALAGPFTNLLCAFFFYLAAPNGAFFLFCTDCSVFLALFNLLPLYGFDGARVLKNLAFLCLPYDKAIKIQTVAEPLFLVLFAVLCGAVCIYSGFNLSLCVILLYLFGCMLCRNGVE